MSPRRHRRAPQPERIDAGLAHSSTQTVEDGPDGRWFVRRVPGGQSDKAYRCPGCDHEVHPGAAHVVAWPQDGAVDERRHWHTPCWRARHTRRPHPRRRG
ncbi:MAG: hypothetical protein ACRDXX_04630 [Stackebrandtia sp.]